MIRKLRLHVGVAVVLVAALAAASAPATAAIPASSWPQAGQSARHLGTNPDEHTFTPGNVSQLQQRFLSHFGEQSAAGPVVANGFMYIADFDGDLSAYRAGGCGAPSCEPLWKGHTDNDINGTPAVAGGLVLVASADHFLYAFPAAGCGAALCAPRWKGQMIDGAVTSDVAVADGVAYVGDFSGHVYAFPVAGCGAAICKPRWTGVGASNETIGSPAVANGKVYVPTFRSTPDLFTGRLLTFAVAGCGRATCTPLWTADLGGPGTGVAVSGSTVFAGSSTLFGDGVNTAYHLFAFAGNGCGATVCKPLRAYLTGEDGMLGAPAVSAGTVYATSRFSPDAPVHIGVVSAYRAAGCGAARCNPTWTGVNLADGIASSPVVVGGVVFVGKGPASGFPVDAALYGFDAAGCGAAICADIAFVQLSEQQGYLGEPLAVGGGLIYMASHDNIQDRSNVYAIGLPG